MVARNDGSSAPSAATKTTTRIFDAPTRAAPDEDDRQRTMRREKYESVRDAPPPLRASQRGLFFERAVHKLFYALGRSPAQ